MTPTLQELQALFVLLYSVFKREKVWVVRLRVGQEPKLYPMARAALKSLEGNYNPKAQEHIFVLDPQPAMHEWANQLGVHHEKPDGHAVLEAALEQGRADNPQPENAPDQAVEPVKALPAKPKGLLTALDEPIEGSRKTKLAIWIGDTPMGFLVSGSNPECWTAQIGKTKVGTLAPLETTVTKLLEAAGLDANEINALGGLIMPDGSIIALGVQAETSSTTSTPTTEEAPVQIANFGDLNPLTPAHLEVITQTEMVLIERIRAVPELQTRAAMHTEIVDEYAAKLERGIEFEPVEVWTDDDGYLLVDGFHRLAAHRKLNREWVKAIIKTGDKREAFLAALQANQQHGLRRSSADKRHAIKLMLADDALCNWSDRRIAEFLDVDGKTVATVRNDLEFAGEIQIQDVRKSASGATVPAKRTQAPPNTDSPMNLGSSSESKPSLEHGSTRGDQRTVFKTITAEEVEFDPVYQEVRFNLIGVGNQKSWHQIGFYLEQKRFTYQFQDGSEGGAGKLTAQSWTGAVIEYLGTRGIVSPDLEITWVNLDGEQISPPPNPLEMPVVDAPLADTDTSSQASDVPEVDPILLERLHHRILDLETALKHFQHPGGEFAGANLDAVMADTDAQARAAKLAGDLEDVAQTLRWSIDRVVNA